MQKIEYSISECEKYIDMYSEKLDKLNSKESLDQNDIKYKDALNKRIDEWKTRLKRKVG